MAAKHQECLHEDTIQGISRKTAELEANSKNKEKRLDELNDKIEKIDEKLDSVLEGLNAFKLQSKTDDTTLELRLKAIETRLDTQEKDTEEARKQSNFRLGIVTAFCAIFTVCFNIYIYLH